MVELTICGGFLFLAGFGFWIMDRIDRFLASGALRPYWDEETEAAQTKPAPESPPASK